MSEKVAAIIVTYNPELSILTKNISSMRGQVDRIYVIDNNSSNQTEITNLCCESEQISLVKLDSNKGLSFAQNIGLKMAKKEGAFYAILFDQDSILDDDGVLMLRSEFRKYTNSHKLVAAIGPSFYDEKTKKPYHPTVFCGPFLLDRYKNKSVIEVDFIIASGCMLRLDLLDTIGYMNDNLFIDYIDVEWSYRAKSYGYKLLLHRGVTMSHSIGDSRANLLFKSVSIHSAYRRYYLFRNYIYISKLSYVALGYKVREFILNILRFIVSLFTISERKKLIQFTWLALKDGIANRLGVCSHNQISSIENKK